MYEELTDRLKNLAALEIRNAESVIDVSAEAAIRLKETAQEAADAIEFTSKAYQMMAEAYEAEVAKQGWIPVTERLPEPHVKVLCYCRAGIVEVLQWSPDTLVTGWYKDYRTTYMSGFVTHWMPIPTPPKTKEPTAKDILVPSRDEREGKE